MPGRTHAGRPGRDGHTGRLAALPVSHLETLHRKAATSLGLEGSRMYVGREVGKAFPAEETGQGTRERAAEPGKTDEGRELYRLFKERRDII